MAICGCCWICGDKFDCGTKRCDACAPHEDRPALVELAAGKNVYICFPCVERVESGAVGAAISALDDGQRLAAPPRAPSVAPACGRSSFDGAYTCDRAAGHAGACNAEGGAIITAKRNPRLAATAAPPSGPPPGPAAPRVESPAGPFTLTFELDGPLVAGARVVGRVVDVRPRAADDEG